MSKTRAAFSYHNKTKAVVTQLDSTAATNLEQGVVSAAFYDKTRVLAVADFIISSAAVGNFMPIAWLYDDAEFLDAAILNLFKNVAEDTLVAETATFAVVKGLVDQGAITDLAQLSLTRSVFDQFAVSDVMRPELGKVFLENSTVSEDHSFAITKALLDALYVTDDIDGEASILDDQEIQFFKNVTHVASASDSLSLQMNFVRLFTETPAVSEALFRQLGRNLSDTAVPVDTLAVGYGASKTENAFLSDALSRLVAFSRAFSDQPVVAEAVSKTLSRSVGDSSTAVDALARAAGKQITDTAAAQENAARAVGKITTDGIETTEILLRQFGATRADTGFITDAHRRSHSKVLADSLFFSDTLVPAIVFERSFQNTANVTDDVDGLASILDDQEISFVKTNNNTLFVAETDVLEMGKVFEETASFADAGSLTSQGYCDLSYFASDYVGAVRTF